MTTHRLQVRFADTDAQRHVYFANYLTFFDEAVSAHFRELGLPWQRLLELGVDLVYVDSHVTYQGRATFEEQLLLEVAVEKIGNSSLTMKVVATKEDGTPVAKGELTSVCIDKDTMKPVRLPDALRERLKARS